MLYFYLCFCSHPIMYTIDTGKTMVSMSIYKFSPGSEIPQQELKCDSVCHNCTTYKAILTSGTTNSPVCGSVSFH